MHEQERNRKLHARRNAFNGGGGMEPLDHPPRIRKPSKSQGNSPNTSNSDEEKESTEEDVRDRWNPTERRPSITVGTDVLEVVELLPRPKGFQQFVEYNEFAAAFAQATADPQVCCLVSSSTTSSSSLSSSCSSSSGLCRARIDWTSAQRNRAQPVLPSAQLRTYAPFRLGSDTTVTTTMHLVLVYAVAGTV